MASFYEWRVTEREGEGEGRVENVLQSEVEKERKEGSLLSSLSKQWNRVRQSPPAVCTRSRTHDRGPPDLLCDPDGADAAAADEASSAAEARRRPATADERASEPAAKLARADQPRVAARHAAARSWIGTHINAHDTIGGPWDDVAYDSAGDTRARGARKKARHGERRSAVFVRVSAVATALFFLAIDEPEVPRKRARWPRIRAPTPASHSGEGARACAEAVRARHLGRG